MLISDKKEIPNDLWYNGHKIQIFPTEDQKEYLNRCIDASRFIYNWYIAENNMQLEKFNNGEVDKSYLDYYDVAHKYTDLRKELDFLQSVPYSVGQKAIMRAARAYDRFFKKITNKPKFKKKKDKYQSYHTRSDTTWFEDNMLKLEGLKTLIYTNYHSGLNKDFRKLKKIVISRNNMNDYYISFSLLEPRPLEYFEENNIEPLGRAIGIDLNGKKRAVLSTGEIYHGPDLSRELVNLKNKRSKVSKDINRRKNMEKTNPSKDCQSKRADKRYKAMQKQYRRIHNITNNFNHETTKDIIKKHPDAIVMETLYVKDMQANKNIAKHIQYVNFGSFIETMKYKCNKYGIPFIQAPKDYPSSQICSNCGNRQEIKLSQKKYKCEKCGLIIDRDINAALNLEHLAYNR